MSTLTQIIGLTVCDTQFSLFLAICSIHLHRAMPWSSYQSVCSKWRMADGGWVRKESLSTSSVAAKPSSRRDGGGRRRGGEGHHCFAPNEQDIGKVVRVVSRSVCGCLPQQNMKLAGMTLMLRFEWIELSSRCKEAASFRCLKSTGTERLRTADSRALQLIPTSNSLVKSIEERCEHLRAHRSPSAFCAPARAVDGASHHRKPSTGQHCDSPVTSEPRGLPHAAPQAA